jgi:hypothetical protein
MNDDRSSVIIIDGEKYPLLLTTLATKEIVGKFGGIENLGEKLSTSENLTETFDDVLWLITLLANQPILRYNAKNKDSPKPLLTTDELELFTEPADLTEYKDAIMFAIIKGTKRNIESEDDGKNAKVG